jgi:hypothetical protein
VKKGVCPYAVALVVVARVMYMMSLIVSRGGTRQTGVTSSVLPCWTRCLAVWPHPVRPGPQGRFPPPSACTRFLASRSLQIPSECWVDGLQESYLR